MAKWRYDPQSKGMVEGRGMARVEVIKVSSAGVADESGFKDINSQGASQTFVNLYKHSFSQFIFL